jgi:hypothetical protein
MRVPKKRTILIWFTVLSLCLTATVRVVLAACNSTPNSSGGADIHCTGHTPGVENGTPGDDHIVNDGQLDGYIWGAGFGRDPNQTDTIINNGTVGDGLPNAATNDDDDGLWGSPGSDTIINNGTVNGGSVSAITGDGDFFAGPTDHDTIINNGTVNGDINGDFTAIGNDTIIINGVVNGDVYGDVSPLLIALGGTTNGGNDSVILQNNGVVTGVIDGGPGQDTLTFEFQIEDYNEYQHVMDSLSGASAAGGSLTYGGHVFTWRNFEQLINLIQFIGLVEAGAMSIEELVNRWSPGDGRINSADAGAPAAVYCQEGGVVVVDITDEGTGGASFAASPEQVQTSLSQATGSGQHVMIAEGSGHSLWALSSNELQLHSDQYDFIFQPGLCAA